MMRLKHHPFIAFQSFLLALALSAMLIVQACEKDNNPAADPACGSGKVSWDEKAQVCRDQANGRIVPASCCNR